MIEASLSSSEISSQLKMFELQLDLIDRVIEQLQTHF